MRTQPKRWLGKRDLRHKIGLSNATIDRLENPGEESYDPEFPTRFYIGGRCFWWEHEIDEWMEARAIRR
jgi:predicted DNA-binding transcriptional regulator AlpA